MKLQNFSGIELSQVGEHVYTAMDYIDCLERIGVTARDILCVHSSLLGFGRPYVSKEKFLDTIIKIFQFVLGPRGTLIMPTFTYSFCNNEIYDVNQSPSTVGVLTEYFRKMEGVKRTKHPIFSFAVWGEQADEYIENDSVDAFGDNGVYGKLIRDNGKLLLFGAPRGYTFYYLSEERVRVDHRYFKYFQGEVKDKESSYIIEVPYYVRKLDKKSILDEDKLSSYLKETCIQSEVKLGRASLLLNPCREMYDSCCKTLSKTQDYFLID